MIISSSSSSSSSSSACFVGEKKKKREKEQRHDETFMKCNCLVGREAKDDVQDTPLFRVDISAFLFYLFSLQVLLYVRYPLYARRLT